MIVINENKLTPALNKWISQIVELCDPKDVYLCNGSENEYQHIMNVMQTTNTIRQLNEETNPNSFLALSQPKDVARVEDKTFICTKSERDAGPTNNWMDANEMKKELNAKFKGTMKGRCCYIIPYIMGPVESKHKQIGIQITDSPYVVANMFHMTRMGDVVLKYIDADIDIVQAVHSVGIPEGSTDFMSSWPCNTDEMVIAHFPEDRAVWSYGSGYGGNALLGKKCHALRLASSDGFKNGWFAEHMLIIGVTNPEGEKKYLAAAFPSACGKTNFALMKPTLPDWTVEVIGDDIAWLFFDDAGKMRAINPEKGFFGVVPGTSEKTNPVAYEMIQSNTIFTNVAVTEDGQPWWKGKSKEIPENITDWKHNLRQSNDNDEPMAHPNSRFTVSIEQCPILDSAWNDGDGVEISAIIFGGRRSDQIPLVTHAKDWLTGVLMGATLTSESTAATVGKTGIVKHDPFAMRSFCGYHIGDYFGHWLSLNERKDVTLPDIFQVNWFQRDESGRFLWPGFGDNIRVVEWMFKRIDKKVSGVNTIMGVLPSISDLNLGGTSLDGSDMVKLMGLSKDTLKKELKDWYIYFKSLDTPALDPLLEQIKQILS
ncbi:phosphoenolpyruvate carboxykinase (GTP) [Chlamydiia bacterium]|nr:phosphoenolpyruvate carboxykinase (GTP) [Chlamydiia bacterium]